MPTLKIDDIPYELDSLSENARNNLNMLKLTEQEIQRLQLQLAIAQTARNAYANTLKQNLPTPLEQVQAQGETMKFS